MEDDARTEQADDTARQAGRRGSEATRDNGAEETDPAAARDSKGAQTQRSTRDSGTDADGATGPTRRDPRDDGARAGDGGTRDARWDASRPRDPRKESSDAVWSFRGYELRPGEFNTAMVHLFRAEITRANTWRLRLDATTNWAVISTGAAISFTFRSNVVQDHGVIILNTLLVTLFLYIEARRYRYYELWSYRVRLMETDFFAAMLVPPFRPAADWDESLAENLLSPSFPISMWEAFGRRFRRNYMWIYVLLGLAWVLKLVIHPVPAEGVSDFVDRAAIGADNGEWVIFAGILFNAALMAVGLLTVGLRRASGEVLPRYGAFQGREMLNSVLSTEPLTSTGGVRFRPSRRREQVLGLVITNHPEEVAKTLLDNMRRGVTALSGKGMYTGEERSVLMSALTVTEVKQFEALVKEADSAAFIIVTPAQEVMGSGFIPLEQAEPERAGRMQR